MQVMEVNTWTEFKTLVATKLLLMQYTELGSKYDVYASEGLFMWHCSIDKVTPTSSDQTDFETNFKSTANAALENKAAAGRPERVAASPQPNNTTEKWKGFHVEMDITDSSAIIDITFDTSVYLKGGIIYSNDCSNGDHIKADIVLKANPAYVIKANILQNVYMLQNTIIPFMSSECMLMPSTVMLRVTYTKTDTETKMSVSALADYFEVNT